MLQGAEVSSATLLDVAGAVPTAVTEAVLKACRSGSFAAVQTAIADTIAEGWPVRKQSVLALRQDCACNCSMHMHLCTQAGEDSVVAVGRGNGMLTCVQLSMMGIK